MPQIKTSIVILNWNGKKFLEKFLPIVMKYSSGYDKEVVVADNNSADDSIAFLKENYPSIKLIELDKNYGFTGGYNKALEMIDSEYFILLNSDIEVTPGWIDPIIQFMDEKPDIAACMPKIKSYHEKEKFEYAGASGGFIDKFGYPFCRGRIFNHLETDQGQYDDAIQVFWATGACFFVRAEIFKKLNGFDNDFFAHMEEIDLCWRINHSGHKIYCFPKVEIFHVGGGTLPKNNPWKTFLNYRNNLFLLFKNLPSGKLFPIILIRLYLDGLSITKLLFSFKMKDAWAIVKAHFAVFRNIGRLRKKRKAIVSPNSLINNEILYPRSIVFQYFIKEKRTFLDLY
jgi:GT2 family glycosyltransferase